MTVIVEIVMLKLERNMPSSQTKRKYPACAVSAVLFSGKSSSLAVKN